MTIWQPEIASHVGPRYVAIADALASDIRERRLSPGDRLPTHRDLAYRLGVTVGTVTRAYGEAQRRGLIEGEIGRGTFVRGNLTQRGHAVQTAVTDAGFESRDVPVPLHVNFPTELDAIGEDGTLFSRALSEIAAAEDLGQLFNYQPHGGLARHREAACRFLRFQGIEATPDHVVITAGAQHAMFVALGTICEPGDVIVTEAMTWPGLRRLADFLRLRIQGLPMDEDGILPDALQAACQARKVTALYCVPNMHNPTTLTTPLQRRKELAEIAKARRADHRGRRLRILVDDGHHPFRPWRPSLACTSRAFQIHGARPAHRLSRIFGRRHDRLRRGDALHHLYGGPTDGGDRLALDRRWNR
jgi:DNA-binding transcriptional MocR family regulator